MASSAARDKRAADGEDRRKLSEYDAMKLENANLKEKVIALKTTIRTNQSDALKQYHSGEKAIRAALDNVEAIASRIADNIQSTLHPPDPDVEALKKNTTNFALIGGYTHEIFIENRREYAPYLLSILDEILGGPDQDERVKIKATAAKALIFATLLSAADPDFVWDYGSAAAFSIRAQSHSATAVDICAAIFPGTPTNETLRNRVADFADEIKEKGVRMDTNTCVRVGYDNCPSQAQSYLASHSRAGRDPESGENKAGAVVCAMQAHHDFGVKGEMNIQKMVNLSPRNDLAFTTAPPDIYAHRTTPLEGSTDTDTNEAQCFLDEKIGFLAERLKMHVGMKELIVAMDAVAAGNANDAEDALVEEANATKKCLTCGKAWMMSKIKCSEEMGGCGVATNLPTKAEWLHVVKQPVFLSNPAQHSRTYRQRAHKTSHAEQPTEKVETADEDENTKQPAGAPSDGGAQAAEGGELRRDALPIYPINPSTKANRKAVMRRSVTLLVCSHV
jgi:hypothetical protein